MKLHGLVPNFYIFVSLSDLYIPTICPFWSTVLRLVADRGNTVYKSLWEGGRAVSFLGIFFASFRYSAFAVCPFKNSTDDEKKYICHSQERTKYEPICGGEKEEVSRTLSGPSAWWKNKIKIPHKAQTFVFLNQPRSFLQTLVKGGVPLCNCINSLQKNVLVGSLAMEIE